MKKDCRENCASFNPHIEGDRLTVCGHKSGPEIVYPRIEPWACSLWRKRSSKLPAAKPDDKVFCMVNGHDIEIQQCTICRLRPNCPTIEMYYKKHIPKDKQ